MAMRFDLTEQLLGRVMPELCVEGCVHNLGSVPWCSLEELHVDDRLPLVPAEQKVPPFVVFSDKTLHEMARRFPTTAADMLQVTGVGETKLDRYGTAFMETIQTFLDRSTSISKKSE